MCLIAFDWQPDAAAGPVFTLTANRDEFFRRTSAPLSWWEDVPGLLAGRDLEAGGTWLGVSRDGRFAALTNYRAPSFDSKTGLFIVDAHPSWSIYFAKPADGAYGWAGADYGLWGKGVIEAIDYQTGKIRWSHQLGEGGSGAGVMTTASGLTVTGDAHGNMLILNTADGKTLWHAGLGSPIQSSPISYELDGRQYIVNSSGGLLFAWALPQNRTPGQKR